MVSQSLNPVILMRLRIAKTYEENVLSDEKFYCRVNITYISSGN